MNDLIELASIGFETLFAFVANLIGDGWFLLAGFGVLLWSFFRVFTVGVFLVCILFFGVFFVGILFFIRWFGPVFDPFAPGLDESSLERAGFLDPFDGLLDEAGGSFGVFDVGSGDAPIVNRAVRIDRGGLAKRSFGFEVPEPVQLRDALIKEPLRHGVLGRDLPMDVAHPLHQVGRLAGTFIEHVGMERMPWRFVLGRIGLVVGPKNQRRNEQDPGG